MPELTRKTLQVDAELHDRFTKVVKLLGLKIGDAADQMIKDYLSTIDYADLVTQQMKFEEV